MSWLPSKRQGSGDSLSRVAAATDRLKKLKRLRWLGWSMVIVGILLLFAAVLVYFVLGKCGADDPVRSLKWTVSISTHADLVKPGRQLNFTDAGSVESE